MLLADDERLLADTVADGLRKLAMAVDVCYDGEAAMERLGVNRYDVAVLDRDMPGRTGDEVCRWMVESQLGTRILILTAASGIRDRVDGLGLGADDYLTKPFAFAELVARIQALARRPPAGFAPVLDQAGVVLDIPRHRAMRDGRVLDLTPKEFAVLSVLMHADGTDRERRGPARAGVGRERRPVHQRRPGRGDDAAQEARRPAGRAHRAARRLPVRRARPDAPRRPAARRSIAMLRRAGRWDSSTCSLVVYVGHDVAAPATAVRATHVRRRRGAVWTFNGCTIDTVQHPRSPGRADRR